MRLGGFCKLAAAGALAVTMMAPGFTMAQAGKDAVLKPAEMQKLIPGTVFYRGQTAPTELRNSGGVKLSDGYYVLAALVDTSGYTTGVQSKYQASFITEVPIILGGHNLAAGAYGVGFVGGKLLVTDLGAHDLFAVTGSKDAALKRPMPLQVMADPAGGFRLYIERNYVVFSR